MNRGGGISCHCFEVLTLVLSLAGCLPHGEDKLPHTDVEGVARDAVLRLLVPDEVRRAGAVVPITVEVTFSGEGGLAAEYCVQLAGEPGKLEFPFGDECGGSDAGDKAMAAASMGSAFSRTRACLRPQSTAAGQRGATSLAAYVPKGQEASATLFGALYDNGGCTGKALVSTARLLEFRGATTPGAGMDSVDGGTVDGGTVDGGSTDAGGGDAGPGPSPPISDAGITDAGGDAS